MGETNDRLRQAVDALHALGDGRQPGEQTEPAEQSQQAEPTASWADEQATAAGAEVAALQEPVVRVVLKKAGTVTSAMPKKQEQGNGPPAVLTPVQRVQRRQQIEWRRTAIPMLLTTGLAMVLLGIWSAGVLAGGVNLLEPGAKPSIQTVWLAKLSLLAWPVGAVLLTGAGFFMHDVYRWYRMYPPQKRAGGARAS